MSKTTKIQDTCSLIDGLKQSIFIHALKYASFKHSLQIGDLKIHRIHQEYGSIEAFLQEDASEAENKERFGLRISTAALNKLVDPDDSYARLKEYQEQGISFTNILADDYPEQLRELEKPPMIIYYYGDLSNFDYQGSIGIVGTRKASLYGRRASRSLVLSLKDYQATIISGMARGIDSEAHMAAIRVGLPTVAVLGAGLLSARPGYHKSIFETIKKDPRSLLLSEFEPSQGASIWSFPQRNRIISALSRAAVVVEAGIKSGALITARHSEALKRSIYALPGELDKTNFLGNNQLFLENKASPLYSSKQLVEDLDLRLKQPAQVIAMQDFEKTDPSSKVDGIEEVIIRSIGKQPVSFDVLQQKTKLSAMELATQLSILEINGVIKKSSGSRYQKS